MTDAIPELVVLLDAAGAATGTARKDTLHPADPPLHLAFSLYAFDASDRLLLTQRAASKVAFPLLWTNSVCGHPAPGEPLESAVRRRARDEMGLELAELRLVLPQFRYREELLGIVEHEACPVLVARAISAPRPHPQEVAAWEWMPWADFADEVMNGRRPVSPWCAAQVGQLLALGAAPQDWPTADPRLLPPAIPSPAPPT